MIPCSVMKRIAASRPPALTSAIGLTTWLSKAQDQITVGKGQEPCYILGFPTAVAEMALDQGLSTGSFLSMRISASTFNQCPAAVRPLGSLARRHNGKRLVAMKLFTGIVQGTANIVNILPRADSMSFDTVLSAARFEAFHKMMPAVQIEFPETAVDEIQIGASVALNGTCLTVTSAEANVLRFDIIPETLKCTNLGQLHLGAAVNFERSVKYGDEVGGHNVSGHVHTTAEIAELDRQKDNATLTFKVKDSDWMKYIMPKGFISVDGCSLTVGEVGEDWFKVYLIPETMRATVLGIKQKGDLVNIEIDAQTQAIVTAVERHLSRVVEGQIALNSRQGAPIA